MFDAALGQVAIFMGVRAPARSIRGNAERSQATLRMFFASGSPSLAMT
jgi:hypothetical protein